MEVIINGKRYLPERKVSKEKMPLHLLMLDARLTLDETMDEAAIHIGTTKSHIWALESGNAVPRLPMLQRILKHYGISFDEIRDEIREEIAMDNQPKDHPPETEEHNSFDPKLHACSIITSLAITGWCCVGLLIFFRF